MSLLDLPLELLNLIVHYLGPCELRKSVSYLLVAKRWYRAVLPVYLSELPLSTLYLASHHDLDSFPPPHTALAELIQAKTKRLSIRLVGHPSKCPSMNPWHDSTELGVLDSLLGHNGAKDWKTWDCDWMTVGPEGVGVMNQQTRWHWRREKRTLHQWARRINKRLVELAAILPNTKGLEEFSLEASSEDDGEQGPRWDYLHDSTIRGLISSLPSSLNNLTLDLCGSRAITPDRGRETIHLCPLIAERLCDFQNVRLRLRCMCPQVFQSSSSRPNAGSRLRTLVIRLNLPYFPQAAGEVLNRDGYLDPKSCVETAVPLYKTMIAAGVDFAKRLPGLSMMRISYRSSPRSIVLAVADCITGRYMLDPSLKFVYEDDGVQWAAWEDSGTLRDGGSLRELFW